MKNREGRHLILNQSVDSSFKCDCEACAKDYPTLDVAMEWSACIKKENCPRTYVKLVELLKENWEKIDNMSHDELITEAWPIQMMNFVLMSFAAYLITWPCEHLYDRNLESSETNEEIPDLKTYHGNFVRTFPEEKSEQHDSSVWLTEEE
jgi:hypothetical protein